MIKFVVVLVLSVGGVEHNIDIKTYKAEHVNLCEFKAGQTARTLTGSEYLKGATVVSAHCEARTQ